MPRPKVHESQRQRAAEACSFCRDTKKKCSGTAPCTQCQRRGLHDECFITYLPRGSRLRTQRAAASAGRQSWNSVSQASVSSAQDATSAALLSPTQTRPTLSHGQSGNAADSFRPLSPSESREENDDSIGNAAQGSAQTPRPSDKSLGQDSSFAAPGPRMLLSSHGERGMESTHCHMPVFGQG